jgi:periplasmic divalent cation tolerance protein
VIDNVLIVLTNCPDTEDADRLARTLVEQKLAACVNRLPAVNSVYRWQGAVERAIDVPLLIKSTRERLPEIQEVIRALHPYEVPEIVAIPVVAGLPAYLRWVVDETQPPLMA